MVARTHLFSAVLLAAVSPFALNSAHAADAVITWNANAGVAATKACIAPLDDPFHEFAHVRDDAHRHP